MQPDPAQDATRRSKERDAAGYDRAFRPRSEPAGRIYDAFQEEAGHRGARVVEAWQRAAREAVHVAACSLASRYGLRAPGIEEVAAAERYAMGHIDYGAKWAITLVEAMRRPAA